jgi:hypothetical protein
MTRRNSRRQSLREKENNSENVLQSPTPYWKVAQERGISPTETRSTKKKKNDGGTRLQFSPLKKENAR